MAVSMALTVVLPASNSYANSEIYTEELSEIIEKDEKIDVLIELDDKMVNFVKVQSKDDKKVTDKKREIIVDNLQKNAENSQKNVLDYLKKEQENGKVKEIESFYIVNSIRVVADREIVENLKSFSNIKKISVNGEISLNDKISEEETVSLSNNNSEWNLENTGVKKTWDEFNIKGDGVVIGFIDSGVDYKHSALEKNWRGYQEGGNIRSDGNWLDLVDDSNTPVDNYGHGTAVTGVAVGKETSSRSIGVAPNSKWIAVRAFSKDFALNSNIIKAAQWMLAPGGNPENAPDIVNNSWGGVSENDAWFAKMIKAWTDAGIFPIFAAGNEEGSKTAKLGSIENPASLLEAFSVGAVDNENIIGKYSKRGPSKFDNSGSIIKPELVAPGTRVVTTSNNNNYARWTGTSFATPHVSGIVALMKEAYPDITPEKIREILILSADPLTDSSFRNSPNMAYGYGLADAYEAVCLAKTKGISGMDFARVKGSNRYETSEKISQDFFKDGSETVYIANGNKFADGLAMGPLTSVSKGPLILTDANKLSNSAKQEIKRLNPKKVIVIGGKTSISDNILVETQEITKVKPTRISGSNRYETSIKIAENLKKDENNKKIYLVNGTKDADAISVASIASKTGSAIITNTDKSLLPSVKEYIKNNGISDVVIIGGKNTLSPNIEKELQQQSVKYERIAGSNRFETATMINQKYFKDSGEEVFLANGFNTADALAIGPVSGMKNAPIQIIPKDEINTDISNYLSNPNFHKVYFLGGNNSISEKNYINILNLYKAR